MKRTVLIILHTATWNCTEHKMFRSEGCVDVCDCVHKYGIRLFGEPPPVRVCGCVLAVVDSGWLAVREFADAGSIFVACKVHQGLYIK